MRRIAARIAAQIMASPEWATMRQEIREAADAISRGLVDAESLRLVQRALDNDYRAELVGIPVAQAEERDEARPITAVVGTLSASLPALQADFTGTYTPAEEKTSSQGTTLDSATLLVLFATITSAVDSVINDSPEEGWRSTGVSLAIVILYWLMTRPRGDGRS